MNREGFEYVDPYLENGGIKWKKKQFHPNYPSGDAIINWHNKPCKYPLESCICPMKYWCEECLNYTYNEKDLTFCDKCNYEYCKNCIDRHVGVGNCGIKIE